MYEFCLTDVPVRYDAECPPPWEPPGRGGTQCHSVWEIRTDYGREGGERDGEKDDEEEGEE